MAETLSQVIIDFLAGYNISHEITIFVISLLPVLELRGGLIAAAVLDVPIIEAFVICFIANILPIPFILLFIKKIFFVLKKFKLTRPLVEWLERKAANGSKKVETGKMVGLYAFVAVPLPGTGGWTGALIASFLNMPIKKSLPTIIAGVFTAGLIMLIVTYFIPGLFF